MKIDTVREHFLARVTTWPQLGAWLKSINSGLAELYRLCGSTDGTLALGRTVRMPAGTVLRLAGRADLRRIEVRYGVVWLTGGSDSDDIFLGSGDAFVCTGHGPFVLQALHDAEVSLRS